VRVTRRAALAGLSVPLGAWRPASPPSVTIRGSPTQGGYVVVATHGALPITLDDQPAGTASRAGIAVIGFDRDAPATSRITISDGSGLSTERTLTIAPRTWSVQRIDGLPPSTVTPTDPALLARIRREADLKTAAFASADGYDNFAHQPWVRPTTGRFSSSFGNQRILNGEPGRPHYGVDIAAGRGTPVVAPAAGLVVLSEPDLHFEGGLLLIDHGQGLVGAFLHLSRLDVRVGERVAKAQRIGAVGSSGRATGAHLCWRLKWRGRNLDPSLWLTPPAAV